MKKKLSKLFAVLFACMLMSATFCNTAFAVSLPYKNIHTTSGNTTATIDTRTFSGYSNKTIRQFSVQTQDYSSSSVITVYVYYGNTLLNTCILNGNTSRNNIGCLYAPSYPAGVYTIRVSVAGSDVNGWTGVWLFY